jgi:hypothetical protein
VIRILFITGVLLACTACNDTSGGRAWYEPGDATYDALKSASDACKAKGGQFQLRPGGDSTHMGDYQCLGAKAS